MNAMRTIAKARTADRTFQRKILLYAPFYTPDWALEQSVAREWRP